MGALLATLLPLVPGLIQGIQMAFKGKPKSGADKMEAVTAALVQIAEKMLSGQVPLVDGTQIAPQSVNDQALRGMIEAEFQRLKATGQIDGAGPVATTLYLLRGVVVPVPAG